MEVPMCMATARLIRRSTATATARRNASRNLGVVVALLSLGILPLGCSNNISATGGWAGSGGNTAAGSGGSSGKGGSGGATTGGASGSRGPGGTAGSATGAAGDTQGSVGGDGG